MYISKFIFFIYLFFNKYIYKKNSIFKILKTYIFDDFKKECLKKLI